ncbi:MAG: transposase [Saprospiraceae bacterium]|nr:transposase [Saprospiraceae bacterium]
MHRIFSRMKSTIKVMDNKHKQGINKGYMWVMASVQLQYVCFEYRDGRGREGPMDSFKHIEETFKLTLMKYTIS